MPDIEGRVTMDGHEFFELAIAVNDKDFWNSQSALLSKQLGFLTSDRWWITFVDGGFLPRHKKREEIRYPKK